MGEISPCACAAQGSRLIIKRTTDIRFNRAERVRVRQHG
jgi:hypothetical protein